MFTCIYLSVIGRAFEDPTSSTTSTVFGQNLKQNSPLLGARYLTLQFKGYLPTSIHETEIKRVVSKLARGKEKNTSRKEIKSANQFHYDQRACDSMPSVVENA